MKTVKNRCKKCGYSEKYKPWEYAVVTTYHALLVLLCSCGVLLIYIYHTTGLTPIISSLTQAKYFETNEQLDGELRTLAVNMTRECNGNDPDCYALAVYQSLKGLRYVPDSIYGDHVYNAIYVYENGGDCKGMSNLYRALLNSVGIEAHMSCSIRTKHCVAVVPRIYYNEYYVVDLTEPSVTLMNNTDDVWSYNNAERIKLGW